MLLLAAATTAVAQTDDWAWNHVSAKTKAICTEVGQPNPPAADRPSAAQATALKGCDSTTLYYGIGTSPDYEKARHCAFVEAAAKDAADNLFGGTTTLMQIYANGYGVTRNLNLATAYACRVDGAPAEIEGRVAHLQSLKTAPDTFDYCDDITSGYAMGHCASLESEREAAKRDAQVDALAATFPPAARPLYAAMKKSFDAFVNAHGDGEVDLSGTARGALMIEEKDRVRDQFVKDLNRLASGQWPTANASNAKAADAALNVSYRKALAAAGSKSNLTTIKSEDIRAAQRLWLVWRDAYVRFAATAEPKVSQDAIVARLTRLRDAQLQTIRD
ncbi:MAG: lysozyme inhibitor LprI family protein, partial [Acidobacteriaceae bacterium]|nr:lysozyme inhibitor LprI family protein [Acidobacteriaceae bacterium]